MARTYVLSDTPEGPRVIACFALRYQAEEFVGDVGGMLASESTVPPDALAPWEARDDRAVVTSWAQDALVAYTHEVESVVKPEEVRETWRATARGYEGEPTVARLLASETELLGPVPGGPDLEALWDEEGGQPG